MDKPNTIAACWEVAKVRLVPKDASFVQLVESKRMFYAGISSMFNLILDHPFDDEKQAHEYFNTLEDEINFFFRTEVFYDMETSKQ